MTFFLSLIMGQVISLIEQSEYNTENINPSYFVEIKLCFRHPLCTSLG